MSFLTSCSFRRPIEFGFYLVCAYAALRLMMLIMISVLTGLSVKLRQLPGLFLYVAVAAMIFLSLPAVEWFWLSRTDCNGTIDMASILLWTFALLIAALLTIQPRLKRLRALGYYK